MNKWVSKLVTLVGVALILFAIYLFAKPKIDDYFAKKYNENKIEHYDKHSKENKNKKVEITKDKTQMAGYLSVPDADIKTPVYRIPDTHVQLDSSMSFADNN